MRQLGKKRRSIGIRGQMMWFLCLICLLLLGLFWFLSTQLLEPLYTKHIQKQLTAEAEMIVAEMDDAIAKGENPLVLGVRRHQGDERRLLQPAGQRHLFQRGTE